MRERGWRAGVCVAHLVLWVAVRVVLHLVLEGPTERQVNDEVDKVDVLRAGGSRMGDRCGGGQKSRVVRAWKLKSMFVIKLHCPLP